MLLLAAPALFIGCSNNQIASLQPNNSLTNQLSHNETNTTMSKKEALLASAIFGGEISLDDGENEIKEEEKPSLTNRTVQNDTLVQSTLSAEEEAWLKSAKIEEILTTAKKYLGVKYIWAANGPSAFDCSGFTKYVFKKNGISLPRYSGHQANMGKKVKFENLKKGDLVFFDTAKKFTRTVNHVGIFIGSNKFIHASSGGKKVMITSFNKKKFYKNKFLYARRIVNNGESLALETNTQQDNTFN
jgi:cell wall-associated NlpC family hydrolase